MGEVTMGRVFSAAEALQMLKDVDRNSDGVVTAPEFVTYECARLYATSVGAGSTTARYQYAISYPTSSFFVVLKKTQKQKQLK